MNGLLGPKCTFNDLQTLLGFVYFNVVEIAAKNLKFQLIHAPFACHLLTKNM